MQDTNEHSFKLLQNYIDAASSDVRDQSCPPSYTFEFYVQDHGNTPVKICLPTPSAYAPEATRKNLSKLFKLLDIEELGEQENYANTWTDMPLSLREFIPLVHEAYLQDCADTSSPAVQLRTLETALNFSRRIRILFADDLEGAMRSTIGKKTLIQSLITIMPECPASLTGLSIGFGNASTLDEYAGVVWLNANIKPSEWLLFLHSIDLQRCHNALEMKAAMNKLSDQVASQLGIGLVYGSDAKVMLSEAYENILLSVLENPCAYEQQYPDVSIRFASGSQPSEAVCKDGTITVDLESIKSHTELYDALNSNILGLAAEQARKIRYNKTQINDLKKHVEKKLRLRLLAHDPEIPDFQFKSACQKLLEHSAEVC
jgi:hypothetical protein